MILRLFYILIILTGAELFVRFANWNGEYAGKMILGIITIGLMEMLLIRKKKEKSTGGLWVGFVIVLLLTVLLGLHLPIGFQLF